jgi:hypothetical protein
VTLARIDVFGPATTQTRRGKPRTVQAAWQAHNPDPRMERAMARLPGTGSFYWPTLRDAYRRATVMLRDPSIHAVRIETISGRRVAYMRCGSAYAYTADDR